MVRFLLLLLFILLVVLNPLSAYYPSTLWSSGRIKETLVGIRAGSVIGDGGVDFVALGRKHLFVYRLVEGRLVLLMDHKASGREEWIKLSLFDLDGDGTDEIIVSGFYAGQVSSFVGKIRKNKFTRLAEVSYYLHSLFWEGKKILAGQRRLGKDDFSGPLFKLSWNGKELVEKGEIRLPGGISGKSISLYSVEGIFDKPGFVHLSPSGKIFYYQAKGGKFKKEWTSGQTYGGGFLKGGLKTPVVYLANNEGYLKNVIGAVPSVKSAQMVRLRWSGYGFQEDWASPRLDGAISDFTLYDWDQDGDEEILAAFLLRDKGYVDTLKRQDSLIIVLKTE